MVYRNLSGYFREKYHKKIRKICIDGGFTCPNRDGTRSAGGCIFCGERGSGEHIAPDRSIGKQVGDFFAALDASGADPCKYGFVAYFQNFTNTYAPVEELRKRYDAALTDPRIVALAVGTRPDCITGEIADLLCEYKQKVSEVWVELGLQTSNDGTAKLINRGYQSSEYLSAAKILRERDIPFVVHIIIGLPGETKEDIANTVDFINRSKPRGIKIHSIYVMKDTALERMYREGKYTPPTLEEYIDLAAYVLCHIPPETVVHRLTGDCPEGLLVAPEWNADKNKIIKLITGKMEENGWKQGCFYEL